MRARARAFACATCHVTSSAAATPCGQERAQSGVRVRRARSRDGTRVFNFDLRIYIVALSLLWMSRCRTPGCEQPDSHLGPHDGEILDECTSIATDRHALWQNVEPDIILTAAASKLSVSSHEAISVIHGQAHSCVGQYNRVVKECMPNVDAANHMINADAAICTVSAGSMVQAGATFCVVKVTSKSRRCLYILQLRLLAVASLSQRHGYGSRIVEHLKRLLSMLAAPTPGACLKLVHVRADTGTIAFWSKRGFTASSAAAKLTAELTARNGSGGEPPYDGVTSMAAIVR